MSENTLQVYTIYIRAPRQKVWDAITTSEYSTRWGYGGGVEVDLVPGGLYRNLTTDEMKQMGMGDVAVEGRVIAAESPARLELEWAPTWHPESKPTRLVWELTEYPGLTKVVLTHDLSAAPEYALEVLGGSDPGQGGGGWPWVLSDLKTLLESGEPMAA